MSWSPCHMEALALALDDIDAFYGDSHVLHRVSLDRKSTRLNSSH